MSYDLLVTVKAGKPSVVMRGQPPNGTFSIYQNEDNGVLQFGAIERTETGQHVQESTLIRRVEV